MNESKEFQVEYSIFLPVTINGNFCLNGNPFDREDILGKIMADAQQNQTINWAQCLEITYTISESSRLLDSAWDSHLTGKADTQQILALLKQLSQGRTESKIEKMRKMHEQGNG